MSKAKAPRALQAMARIKESRNTETQPDQGPETMAESPPPEDDVAQHHLRQAHLPAITLVGRSRMEGLQARVTELEDMVSRTALLELDPDQIVDDRPPDRPPSDYGPEALQSLVHAIQRVGQAETISVTMPAESGQPYRLNNGRRRLEACRILGIKVRATAYPSDLPPEERIYIQYALNEEREDVSPFARAQNIRDLVNLQGSQDAVCSILELSKQSVSRYMQVAAQEDDLTRLLVHPGAKEISLRALHELAEELRDPNRRCQLLTASEGLPDDAAPLERLAALRKARGSQTPRRPAGEVKTFKHRGRALFHLSHSRRGTTLRFPPSVDAALVEHIAQFLMGNVDTIERQLDEKDETDRKKK